MGFSDFQASSTFELDGKVLTACEKCQMDHAGDDPPTEPPCDTCRVDLLPENEDASTIYMRVRGQVISAMVEGGKHVSYLSIPAVESAMRIRGVRDPWGCLGRVLMLFDHFRGQGDESS